MALANKEGRLVVNSKSDSGMLEVIFVDWHRMLES